MPNKQPKIFTATIILSGEDEQFKGAGKGRTNFIHWSGRFLFYVPRLMFFKVTAGQLKKLQPQIKPTNPEPFRLAIESNQRGAQAAGNWDGGKATTLLLELLDGKDISDKEFTDIDEKPDKPLHGYSKIAKPEAPATPAEAAADDAAHLSKMNEANAALGAPPLSNRKTKAPSKAEVAEMKKAKAKKTAKKSTNGKKAATGGRRGGKWADYNIKISADAKPRREGTAADGRFKSMKAYLGRHPKATVADVIANSTYRSNDLEFDRKAKNIELSK